jgi:hypothetical protein
VRHLHQQHGVRDNERPPAEGEEPPLRRRTPSHRGESRDDQGEHQEVGDGIAQVDGDREEGAVGGSQEGSQHQGDGDRADPQGGDEAVEPHRGVPALRLLAQQQDDARIAERIEREP